MYWKPYESMFSGIVVVLLVFAFPLNTQGHGMPHQANQPQRSQGHHIEIDIHHGKYQVLGGMTQGNRLILEAGDHITMILRNQDMVAHEFITPLFTRTEVQFSGKATGIFGREAAGFRLDPGTVLTLHLTIPFAKPFTTMYDVIWCTIHSAIQMDRNRRTPEILIVATHETV